MNREYYPRGGNQFFSGIIERKHELTQRAINVKRMIKNIFYESIRSFELYFWYFEHLQRKMLKLDLFVRIEKTPYYV